ncbi:hypothetical protein PFISCL1PPCAC_18452, partial [Pristionchus fissidentatus]
EEETKIILSNSTYMVNYALPPTFSNDLLSNLPDDNLLHICSYLNFTDLDALKCVSQKIQNFAEYQTRKNEKITAAQLVIEQDSRGHIFHLTQRSDDIPNYLYSIMKPAICRKSGAKYMHEIRETYNAPRTHDFPIPSLLFARLEKLLERYSFVRLHLLNVKIDSTFLRNLERTVTSALEIALVGIVMEKEC